MDWKKERKWNRKSLLVSFDWTFYLLIEDNIARYVSSIRIGLVPIGFEEVRYRQC